MKNIFKYIVVLGVVVGLSSSCIKEEFPTTGVSSGQVANSPFGLSASVNAMNAWLVKFNGAITSHGDFGYPGICVGLDALTSDVAVPSYAYDSEFLRWRAVTTVSADGSAPLFVWRYFYTLAFLANIVLEVVDMDNLTELQKVYVGQALVYRAMAYIHLAGVFEYKGTETGGFEGLTVPWVPETMTEAQAMNNPRIGHDQMYAIIEADLLRAIELLEGYEREKKNYVDQSVAYGMLARAYVNMGDRWADAEEAARNAIDKSGCTVTTEAEWMNPTTGFNSIGTNSWMWGAIVTKDNRAVTTGICNFISFMSPEAGYGYVAAGGYQSVKQIDKSLYDRIPDTDWRKGSWLDPNRAKYPYKSTLDATIFAGLPNYTPLKFRPAQGNGKDPLVGSAADFPLMRVEEMYLIEAEAAGMQNLGRGKQLLETFVQSYRDAAYTSIATSASDFQNEVLFQRRIEFWGEGRVFFDLKRLNTPQVRGYVGTNHFSGSRYNNTAGTPCWTTLPIPTLEIESNRGITSATQNPNPQTLKGPEWIQ